MHRLTAKLLLLIALGGNIVPLALATGAAQLPQCCLRKGVHHCHNFSVYSGEGLSVASTSSCSHECCRATTPAQWAHAEKSERATSAHRVELCLSKSQSSNLGSAASTSLSTRAPPRLSIL